MTSETGPWVAVDDGAATAEAVGVALGVVDGVADTDAVAETLGATTGDVLWLDITI